MPKNSAQVLRLTPAYIEIIHDDFVAKYWPGDQPVSQDEYRDRALLDSAANRPFQGFGGVEFYPSVPQKAAPLFHSLVCNHAFTNGNKRTAVVAVDIFLAANGIFLAITNDKMYELAKTTAMHNENGVPCDDVIRELSQWFEEYSVPLEKLNAVEGMKEIYREYKGLMLSVRSHPANQRSS